MSESNEYRGEERRWQPEPSRFDFLTQHVTLWIVGAVFTVAGLGALAYVDTRHVQRNEFMQFMYHTSEVRLLDKIEEADSTITRNQLFNRLGSQTNKPARDQVILQTEDRKGKWERELTSLQQARPES